MLILLVYLKCIFHAALFNASVIKLNVKVLQQMVPILYSSSIPSHPYHPTLSTLVFRYKSKSVSQQHPLDLVELKLWNI